VGVVRAIRVGAAVAAFTLPLAACAPAPATVHAHDPVEHTSPIVLFVSPDSAEVERMRAELGADFETVADDAMWYRAEARVLLDSLHFPYADVGRGEGRFRVGGRTRGFSWRGAPGAWFAVVYDGASMPSITADFDLRDHIHPMRSDQPGR